jgi:hypothetical protein
MPARPDPEQERLKRLRDQQIAARDPHVKTRKFQKDTAQKAVKYRKKITLAGIWAIIPHFWRLIGFALILGVAALLIVPHYWMTKWTYPAILGVALVLVGLGGGIGNALDLRDDIKDHLK